MTIYLMQKISFHKNLKTIKLLFVHAEIYIESYHGNKP